MGAVYLAEREGLGDTVAIKVLRHAWSSPDERRHFDSEQRVLASLNHRYIARLYDAGVFDGRQWFAMELVQGVLITEYCKKNQSTLRQRLQLFRAASEAVSYAHAMLIVHRDLKPSNILVDSTGDVKLVDFGIAKRLKGPQDKSGQTTIGPAPLSLNYSAPEQIRGEADNVLFDVYALGVILYELLTGHTPADLTNASAMELTRWLDNDVEPPSIAVRRGPQEGAQVPAVAVTPSEWKDLDLLCLTACSKQRDGRYRSVEDLIRDVDHFLKKEPLDAHPKSLQYRCLKFCSRNRRAVSAAVLTFLAIAAIISFFSWRLILERDRALA
jgi:serine/threonine-protein kinase